MMQSAAKTRAIMPQSRAPGQARPIVGYRTSPTRASAYATPQDKMAAMDRRLRLRSRTGDLNRNERSITGRDSLGRGMRSEIMEPEIRENEKRYYPLIRGQKPS